MSVLLWLFAMAGPGWAFDVLILDDGDSDTTTLAEEVAVWGHTVDVSSDLGFYEDEFDGTVVSLDDYDAVIWLDGSPSVAFDMQADGQTELLAWVQGGGGLLHFGGSGYGYAYGYNSLLGDVIPLSDGDLNWGLVFVCETCDHPIADGYPDGTSIEWDEMMINDATPGVHGDVVFVGVYYDYPYEYEYSGIFAGQSEDGRFVQWALWGNTYTGAYQAEWDDDDVSVLVENSLQWLIQLPPVADAGGSYSVEAGSSFLADGSGSYDPDGGDLASWEWVLVDDVEVLASGESATISAADVDGPKELTLTLRVTDDEGETDEDSALVVVSNAEPEITGLTCTSSVDEASVAAFSITFSDPEDADVITVSWDWGDGTGATGEEAAHSWADDGSYAVAVKITDDDGGEDTSGCTVTVRNVAPTILGTPATTVDEGDLYSFVPSVEDPGIYDVHVWSGTLPSGGTLDTTTGAISWRPDFGDVGDHFFALTVSDGTDSGSLMWTVTVNTVDSDDDGMPDAWEVDYGLDPTDPSDASADTDGDGRTSLEEYSDGTDPTVYEGPGVPALVAPLDGAEVSTAYPSLDVDAAEAPLGQALTYGYALYSDAACTDLVDEVAGEDTVWTVDTELSENTWYWWTAAASDSYTTGAWADAFSFFVNQENEPPTAPGISSPYDGSTLSEITVTLVVDAASDPDGDALTYGFYLVDSDGAVFASTGMVEGDVVSASWTVDAELTDNADYCWWAFATDEHGLDGAVSEEVCFFVDQSNDAPSMPVILEPAAEAMLDTLVPTIVVENGVDPEGRSTQHRFELDISADFDSASLQVADVVTGSDGTTSWTAATLVEDSMYHLRVRCTDGDANSDWAQLRFRVSGANDPPSIPVHLAPIDGAMLAAAGVLEVENAVDPEGDAISYDFVVFDTRDAVVASVEGLPEDVGTTAWGPPDLYAGTYQWSARAVDAWGVASDWSDPWVFETPGRDTSSEDESGVAGDEDTGKGEGCGCGSTRSPVSAAWLLLGAIGLIARRRSGA